MARKRFSKSQITQKLKSIEQDLAQGLSQEEAAEKLGVPLRTFSRWQRHFGGTVSQGAPSTREKELESENLRLKKIVAEQLLENAKFKERTQ